jgi:hypothetical protein
VQPNRDTHSPGELISELVDGLVGIGMFTMTLFPFAIPALALTVVVILPLVLAALAGVLLAAPVLFAVRGLGRVVLRSHAVEVSARRASAPAIVQWRPSSPERTGEMSR